MPSYFVTCRAAADGLHPVHDRTQCPPECFPDAANEYLGEYLEAAQAIAVARLRYAHVRGCSCCVPGNARAAGEPVHALTHSRS
ncbi:MAG TPA: hypothetical protein VHL79_23735 [Ramlibacter sp.]|jgi:hypothetical protein|nr:hypothetical protein [Ramlibacter sp.]